MALEKMRGQSEQKKEGLDGRSDRPLSEVLSWVKGGITTREHGRPTFRVEERSFSFWLY